MGCNPSGDRDARSTGTSPSRSQFERRPAVQCAVHGSWCARDFRANALEGGPVADGPAAYGRPGLRCPIACHGGTMQPGSARTREMRRRRPDAVNLTPCPLGSRRRPPDGESGRTPVAARQARRRIASASSARPEACTERRRGLQCQRPPLTSGLAMRPSETEHPDRNPGPSPEGRRCGLATLLFCA